MFHLAKNVIESILIYKIFSFAKIKFESGSITLISFFLDKNIAKTGNGNCRYSRSLVLKLHRFAQN